MKIRTADKEMEIGTSRDAKMESSIVNSIRRYFQSDSGKPIQELESAIMGSMERYFEGPSHQGYFSSPDIREVGVPKQ